MRRRSLKVSEIPNRSGERLGQRLNLTSIYAQDIGQFITFSPDVAVLINAITPRGRLAPGQGDDPAPVGQFQAGQGLLDQGRGTGKRLQELSALLK